MSDDLLAELKRMIRKSGFYMSLTAAVVNFANDKPRENDTLLDGMTAEELGNAHMVFSSLARDTADALDKRNVKKTPNEWQRDKTIDRMVVTPFGWTRPGGTYEVKPWAEAVSRKEFLDRMGMSGSMLKEHGTKEFAYMGEIA